MPTFLKYWLPPLLWAGLVSIFSGDGFSSANTSPLFLPLFEWLLPHATPERIQSFHYLIRKLGHFTEFFVLAMLLYRALRGGHGMLWQWRVASWTLSLVLLYAVADEVHQRFVPSRSGAWSDSLLDFFGGCCAVALLYVRYRTKAGALTPVAVSDPYGN
jgi:VanZ family protein